MGNRTRVTDFFSASNSWPARALNAGTWREGVRLGLRAGGLVERGGRRGETVELVPAAGVVEPDVRAEQADHLARLVRGRDFHGGSVGAVQVFPEAVAFQVPPHADARVLAG